MNKFLFAFFLLINFSSFGQKKLNGKFRDGHETKTYSFHKNGTFEYSEGDDLYQIKGKGKYSIKKGKLILSFIGYESLQNSFKFEYRHCEGQVFKGPIIYLRDSDTKRGIEGAFINLSLKYSGYHIGSYEANMSGVVTGTVSLYEKYNDSSMIAVASYYGYDSLTFEFKLKPCKNVVIELVEKGYQNRQIPEGTIREYRIEKFTHKNSGLKGIKLYADSSFVHSGEFDLTLYESEKVKP